MNALPNPQTGRILLIAAPAPADGHLFELAASLALRSPLFVLDAGNAFQGYELVRLLRHETTDYQAALQRVTLARIFTCYQLAILLESLFTGEAFLPQPVLALDVLATFYDQGVRVAERRRLLGNCISHLRQLSRRAAVVVWVRQRALVPPEGLEFLARLQTNFGPVWTPEQPRQMAWQQGGLLPDEIKDHR